jgi:UDP-N-acetylglucosamine diphosphorylase / glucose-1-phosphate thymidylyltransferase / UDP-N-acetylgalactosamine diphosphorylase / glucosamine-1-phosphate N-acetyltransferase / galactosamine-1-phosphate N-acetyltransferase
MTGIILAAGKGTRLGKLTDNMPKPMLEVAGQPVICYVIDGMRKAGADSIVVVVKHCREVIESFLSSNYPEARCAVQGEDYGTAASLWAAKPCVNDSHVLIAFGDIIAVPDSIYTAVVEASRSYGPDTAGALAVNWTDDPQNCGVVETRPDGSALRIYEKVPNPPTNMNNTGVFCFWTKPLFDALEKVEKNDRGEYNMVSAVNHMCDQGLKIATVEHTGQLFDIGSVEKLREADRHLGSLS